MKKDKVIGIIQARMGAERLPGKIGMKISGRPILYHIIERSRRCRHLDEIIVATSINPKDEATAGLAHELGTSVYRGSEEDVLDRFIQAARSRNGSIIVRICADNPLFDYHGTDLLVQAHQKEKADLTYFSSPVPLGTATEVVSLSALAAIHDNTRENKYLEHVVTYFFDHPQRFRLCAVSPPEYLKVRSVRLTIDTEEDLDMMQEIYRNLYREGEVIETRTALEFLEKHPEIAALNKNIQQKNWKEL